jgi:hypothetical protein
VHTGRDSTDDKRAGKMGGSTLQSTDSALNTELVWKALEIAEDNQGDKYLEHLAVVLRRVVDVEGGPFETQEVTKAKQQNQPKEKRGFLARLFGWK